MPNEKTTLEPADQSATNEPVPQAPATQPTQGATNSKMKWGMWAAALVVLLGAGVWVAMAMMNREKPLPNMKIGIIGPFEGESAAYAYAVLKGANEAKKDLAANTIEIIQEDSQCDAKVSPGAAQKLIDQGVVAIIGDNCSSSSLAALEKANAAKVVMISASSSSPKLSIKNDFFFRVVPPDQQQGLFLANLAKDKGYKNVAVFRSDEDYGNGLTEIFKSNFEKLGGKVVASEGVARDVNEVTSQVNTILAAKPEAVFLLNNSSASSVAFMKEFRATDTTTPFYGSDGLYDSSLITSGGAASQGLIFTVFPTGSQSFKDAFAAEYGDQTSVIAAAEGYDAFKALYLAIKDGGARTGEEIAAKLPAVKFTGVSSPIAFDEYGDVKASGYTYGLLEIKGDKFVDAEK
jgi:branched-chain amino acid transport system substrate-binding protein